MRSNSFLVRACAVGSGFRPATRFWSFLEVIISHMVAVPVAARGALQIGGKGAAPGKMLVAH